MKFDYKRLVKFELNIGDKEKKYRMWAGLALLFVSLFTASVWLLLIGGVLVATSFFGWCPAYSGFGHNTLCAGAAATEVKAETEAGSPESESH